MSFNLLNSKQENPFFTKLKILYAKQDFSGTIESAYYLGGVVYSNENYINLVQAVADNTLNDFLEKKFYDTQEDNIELYWIKDHGLQSKVVIILDPSELYESEQILDVIASTNDYWSDVSCAQQIYSSNSNL